MAAPSEGAVEEAPGADESVQLKPNVPQVLAEASSCAFWVFVVLLVIAAVGLFKVHPPGEEELCQVRTLGLANSTSAEQDAVLFACHGLYRTVFLFTRSFSAGFFALCLLPLGCLALGRAARSRTGAAAICRYVGALLVDILAILVLWFPSSGLMTISAGVTVVLAPLTAQWLAIYAAYFGLKASNHQPPHWLEIIYQSYVACWYADTFLWVGTISVLGLWGFSIFEAVRNVLAIVGLRPRQSGGPSEVCRLRRAYCSRASAWCVHSQETCCAWLGQQQSRCHDWCSRHADAGKEAEGETTGGDYQKL